MNEFTKEELEEIKEMMRHARKQAIDTTHNISYQVELKAKSMIDNYCEHESDGRWYQLADCTYRMKRCSKCREEFGRQKFKGF
jgi:uncharacterized Zn finger protein